MSCCGLRPVGVDGDGHFAGRVGKSAGEAGFYGVEEGADEGLDSGESGRAIAIGEANR